MGRWHRRYYWYASAWWIWKVPRRISAGATVHTTAGSGYK